MDGIEGLDDGAYAHFTFQAKQNPDILRFMEPAYYVSSYVCVVGLIALVVVILILRRKVRSAMVTLLGAVGALGLIQLAQTWVPRPRPQEAALFLGQKSIFFLGDSSTVPSYPAGRVLLFTLALILLGRAIWDLLPQGLRMVYVIAAIAVTVWVCVAQFFLALHFVTDVLGALAAAGLIGWIAFLLTRRPLAGRASDGLASEPPSLARPVN